MQDHEIQFHIEEYKALRSEIEMNYDLIFKIERTMFALISAIYAVLFGGKNIAFVGNLDALWFLPPVLAGCVAWRIRDYSHGIIRIGSYIASNIESKLAHEGSGWEYSIRSLPTRTRIPRYIFGLFNPASTVSFWVWTFFALFSIAIAKFFSWF